MRVVSPLQIAVFVALGCVPALLLWRHEPLGEFRAVVVFLAGAGFCYLSLIAVYRLWILWAPLQEGEVPPGSKAEFRYHVWMLFQQMVIQPLTRSNFLPVPMARLLYLAVGTRLATHTYCAGLILDPSLTPISRNMLVGRG